MQIFRHAGALAMGVLLAAALPACSKHNAESPANPPTGVATKTTPDTGGTGTEQPSPPAGGTGGSASGTNPPTQSAQPAVPSGGAAPANGPATTPGSSPAPSGQQPGK